MNLSTLNPNELVGPSGRNVQSAYFDGTGDNIYVSSASGLCNFASGEAFTFQVWFYRLGSTEMVFIGGGSGTFQMGVTTGANGGVRYSKPNFADVFFGAGSVPIGTWTHITLCRNTSNTTRCWINGVSVASTTSDTNAYSLAATYIGSQPAGTSPTNGYLSDMRILKGRALYDPTSSANIAVPTAPLTPIANTSFLLGFSEYRFIDQSPNNFTITRNGDTTQSTFGPYGNNWSNYFDGAGDYLSRAFTSTTDGMYPQGTTYTIEAWFYASLTTDVRIIYDCSASNVASFGGVWLGMNAGAAQFNCRPTTGGTLTSISGGSIAANSWNHIAASVNAGSGRLFLNGTQVGSTTTISACSFTPVGASVGRFSNGYTIGTPDYAGYISNIRLVQSTALYTANFTPPTAPLSSIPNTSLLTCQSNRFLDSSPNNFTLTRNGDVSVQPYVPFPANWSNYFDGTGDYFNIADNAALDFGTGDFTIDLWFYAESVADAVFAAGFSSGSPVSGWAASVYAGSASFTIAVSDTYVGVSNSATISANTWYHYAIVRSGNSFTLYINGVGGTAVTNTSSINTQAAGLNIGRSTYTLNLRQFKGYISNLRIVKGTAVYTANFTPPTTPLTAIPNTSLLTCQSSSFTDFSPNNFTITVTGDVSARFYGPFSGPVPEPVVDVYTTTGVANTWTKRPGAKAVQMIAIGAGGGGGGGAASSNNLSRTGGGGGGGGANGQIIYTADQLPSTLYIRVGASGTGGTSTAAGGAGGNSTIAAADPITSSTSVYCMGGGGGGGKGGGDQLVTVGGGGGGTAGAGTTGTGSSAVAGGLPALGAADYVGGGGGGGAAAETTLAGRAEWGGAGGGSTRQFGNTSLVGGSSLYGGGGGGQGGSMSSNQPSPSPFSATSGGNSGLYINSFSYAPPAGAAATTPANGGAGQGATTLYACGHGGGGGYANVSGGTGYTGGAGGFPGGGGGGGGASTVAGTGGVGGAGGAGRVVLITFF